jgi:hypothetical protein
MTQEAKDLIQLLKNTVGRAGSLAAVKNFDFYSEHIPDMIYSEKTKALKEENDLAMSNIQKCGWNKVVYGNRNKPEFVEAKTEYERLQKIHSTSRKEYLESIKEDFNNIVGEIVEVERDGDASESDGYGSDFNMVLEFKKFGIFLRFAGYYSSYDGHDVSWNNVKQVEPRQVEVTQYFEI